MCDVLCLEVAKKHLSGTGCFLNTVIKCRSDKLLILQRFFFFLIPRSLKSEEDLIQVFLGDGVHKRCGHMGIQLANHFLCSLLFQ